MDDETRALVRGDLTTCDRRGCSETFNPRDRDSTHVTVERRNRAEDTRESPFGNEYCSPRCAARDMDRYPEIDRVNVYDADDEDEGVSA